jgi:hypothetical protein
MEVMTVKETGVMECGSGELATDGTRIEHRWEETGVVEYWSDGWTPDRAWRRMPAYRINCVAAAGLRHSRAPGKRRVENRVGTRKWRSFSHLVTGFYRVETVLTRLFPCFSTQVVDFPRMAMVRHFPDANFTNERELGKTKPQDTKAQRQAELASKMGKVN